MANLIRINLLPVKQGKKRELGRQTLVIFGFVILLTGLANYMWYSSRASERDAKAAKVAALNSRISELERVIGEVNNINKRQKEVNDKLEVLSKLKKGRAGPVKMLDALAVAIPKKVWVSEFDEKALAVKLVGKASSHEDVADFMRGLSTVVWTPKGMGRVVERKRDATTVRVELLSSEGAMEDFVLNDVKPFFSAIDLKRAESKEEGGKGSPAGLSTRRIDFEITMSANYAI